MRSRIRSETMRCFKYIEKPWFQVLSLSVLVLILYFSVITELVRDWVIDENYSHGFLIPLISAFFIWRNRKQLRTIRRKPDGIGLPVTILGLLMLILGTVGAEYWTQRVSLLIVILGLTLYVGGRKIASQLIFPIVFLAFMIPVPYVLYYSISFPLELLASHLAEWAVNLLGIPIVREGNILYLQRTTLQVADICSGLRSLISLSALSAAMAYLTQNSLIKRWILFFSSVPIAIGANVLRLALTAALASIYGEQIAQGFLHQFSGLVVFVFAVICLAFIGGVLRWPRKGRSISSPSPC